MSDANTHAGFDKLMLASCDQEHIEKQADRIAHLETAIMTHRDQCLMGGIEARGVDRELWEKLGNCWEADDE